MRFNSIYDIFGGLFVVYMVVSDMNEDAISRRLERAYI